MPSEHPGSTLRRAAGVVVPLTIGCAVVWVQAWHGPTVLTLSAAHGIDTGDLVAVPFLLLAIAVARRRPARGRSPDWALPVSAVTLGVLLLLAGMLASQGGPLVPSGGGTFDGAIARPWPTTLWTWAAGRTWRSPTTAPCCGCTWTGGRSRSRDRQDPDPPDTPLWIGGNLPYGEHFQGLIDEVRVYDRALRRAEIRRDMATPVAAGAGPGGGIRVRRGIRHDRRGLLRKPQHRRDQRARPGPGAVRRCAPVRRRGRGRAGAGVPVAEPDESHDPVGDGSDRPRRSPAGERSSSDRPTRTSWRRAAIARTAPAGSTTCGRLLVAAAAWFCVVIATARGPWTPSGGARGGCRWRCSRSARSPTPRSCPPAR